MGCFVANAVTLFCVLISAHGLHLPSYMKACKVNDPAFEECFINSGNAALSSLVNGDRAYRVPNFNPLTIPKVQLNGILGLDMNATNVVLNGFSDTKVKKFSLDRKTSKNVLGIHIPKLDVLCDYDVTGKLIGFPIQANGKATFILTGMDVLFTYGSKVLEKNGEKFFNLENEVATVNLKRMNVTLENLFKDNKEVEKQMNMFLNENWEPLFKDMKGAIEEIVLALFRVVHKGYIGSVPVKEIFPDW